MVCVWALLQFMGGWLYGHFIEYAIHRWALHGPGKKKDSLLSFHFHEHHREARRTLMGDSFYHKLGWNGPTKELVGIFLLLMLHLPLVFIAPYFFAALVFSSISYYGYHLKAHLDPEWARVRLSWHYDHHMGPNQNMNYGVRSDMIDHLLGSRQLYYGTTAEQRDHSRRLLRHLQTMRKEL
jgi:sterol desaturase/sphingolipid hydroxylase (fatty acid hydroxylase superfamily)